MEFSNVFSYTNIKQFLGNFKIHSFYCVFVNIHPTYGKFGNFPIQNASPVSRKVWNIVTGIAN
jgi:hypothetical protein